jgi:hypothetical protein
MTLNGVAGESAVAVLGFDFTEYPINTWRNAD